MTERMITIDDLESLQNLKQAKQFCQDRGFSDQMEKLFLEHWRVHQENQAATHRINEQIIELDKSNAAMIRTADNFCQVITQYSEAIQALSETATDAVQLFISIDHSAGEALTTLIETEEAFADVIRRAQILESRFGIRPGRYVEFLM